MTYYYDHVTAISTHVTGVTADHFWLKRNDYIILSYYDSYDDPKNRYIYTVRVVFIFVSKKILNPKVSLQKF